MPIRAKHRSPELPATVIKMDRYMRKDLIEMLDAGLSLPAAFQKSNQLVAQLTDYQFFDYPLFV
ncbi:uncharacterized protein [Physcomitrium patens]|uniref:uncharacterized protein isoform X4 n=1 Tax=Physcomitrium patens TaxID=3218 RepID=UPI003CCE4EC6